MAKYWIKNGTAWEVPDRLASGTSAQCEAYATSREALAVLAQRARKYLRTPAQMADLRDGIVAMTASLPAAQRTAVRAWFQDMTEAVARLVLDEAAD